MSHEHVDLLSPPILRRHDTLEEQLNASDSSIIGLELDRAAVEQGTPFTLHARKRFRSALFEHDWPFLAAYAEKHYTPEDYLLLNEELVMYQPDGWLHDRMKHTAATAIQTRWRMRMARRELICQMVNHLPQLDWYTSHLINKYI